MELANGVMPANNPLEVAWRGFPVYETGADGWAHRRQSFGTGLMPGTTAVRNGLKNPCKSMEYAENPEKSEKKAHTIRMARN